MYVDISLKNRMLVKKRKNNNSEEFYCHELCGSFCSLRDQCSPTEEQVNKVI